MTEQVRQVLLNLLGEYRELDFPANPELLKLHIDAATDRLDAIYQGNDMAAPDSKPTQSELESAQGTIEDKLKEILANIPYDHQVTFEAYREAINSIQAIITTETRQARVDELEKAVQQFIFNTKRNPDNFSEYATARLSALDKEQP